MTSLPQVLAETYRLALMRGLEERLRSCGFGLIAGVDEAGRGSLAGPVVAAAVLVEPGRSVPGVDDSKKLPPRRREELAAWIRRVHPSFAVVAVSPRDIDRLNILEATRLAMGQALVRLRPCPDIGLVDAVRLPVQRFPCLPLIRGDLLSYAVACASIVAKVERDSMMKELDHCYPLYGFARNKGYGAREHREALAAYGPSAVHRLTFQSVLPRTEVRGS